MGEWIRARREKIGNRIWELEKHPEFAEEGFEMPFIEEILRRARLSIVECYQIFYHAKQIPGGGTYFEIGTWIGGSALCAFLGSQIAKNSVNLISIDVGLDENWYRDITQLIPSLKLLVLESDLVKDKIRDDSIDLCFVDGDHRYGSIKRDIVNYWPKIKVGGILLGHDYASRVHKGVMKAVHEIFGRKDFQLEKTRMFKITKKSKELR